MRHLAQHAGDDPQCRDRAACRGVSEDPADAAAGAAKLWDMVLAGKVTVTVGQEYVTDGTAITVTLQQATP